MKRLRNWFLFLIIILIWGSNWSAMKSGLNYIGPFNFLLHRFIFASIALLPILITVRQKIPLDRRTIILLFLIGGINTLSMVFTYLGMVYEKSGISAILTYTQPLFVFCIAIPILKEVVKASRILGAAIGFSGVVLLSMKETNIITIFSTPVISLIIGALLWATAIVYYKKLLTHVNPIVTSFFQMNTGIIVTFLGGLQEGYSFPLSLNYLVIILFVAVGASSVALTLWLTLLREEDATVLSSSSFLIPIAALFFGWLLLKETLDIQSILGAAFILMGVYLVNKS